MANIRIIFIIPHEFKDISECSELMHTAYQTCRLNVNTNVSWIRATKFKSLNLNLKKSDFVVFDNFEGKLFDELKQSKSARIIGPWVVNICLMEGKPIPNFDWPMYNVAMYDCIVTCSHLPKNNKMEIKAKVELMGGCYVDKLLEKVTHLITDSAKSEKYLVAAENGVKLMCPSWVDDVWDSSQTVNVHAGDEQFKKHCCMAFHCLIISSTGITNLIEKKRLEKLVNENGGTFTGKLNLSNTDILICSGDVASSEKYKAARQNSQIKCVNLSWVTDSIAKGYALPTNLYQVQKITSTPTKADKPVNPEFSVLSAIGGPNASQRTCLEESAICSPLEGGSRLHSSKRKAKNDYEDLIESLDIKNAKKAGHFLDGCSVYFAGVSTDHTEKLNKVINLGGATRYDTFSDRVTHVIVGDPSNHEVSLINNKNSSARLVSVHWVIDSIKAGHSVNEEKYLIDSEKSSSQTGSPLSKKGLNLLRANRTATEKEIERSIVDINKEKMVEQNFASSNVCDTLDKLLEEADNSTLTKQIGQAGGPFQFQPPNTSTQQDTECITQDAESEIDKVFENMRFLILGFDDEEFSKLKESVVEHGGDVVLKTYKGIPDYAVVPTFNPRKVSHTASEIVNDLFIADCIREGELILSLNYYHRPFDLPDIKPIETCVVTISGYSGTERSFLKNLIEALGGIAQEQFSRIRQEAKSLLPSTHLLSTDASGKKYEAALKWGLPVVSKDWLFECARTGKRIHEENYLVGDSKVTAPTRREDPVENNQKISINDIDATTLPRKDSLGHNEAKVLTPVNYVTPYHKRFLNSAEKFSQVTPVNKIMKQFRESNLNSVLNMKDSKEYTIPQPWEFLKTPNTPLGACITPDPSPNLRKQFEYWLQQFPERPSPKSNKSTPLSEIKRQLWEKITKNSCERLDFNEMEETSGSVEQDRTKDNIEMSSAGERTPENEHLANRLQLLEDMLSASGSGKRQSRNFQTTIPVPGTSEFKDSQPCTVGWDFRPQEEPQTRQRIFALSGVADDSERVMRVQQLEQLGGTVTSLANYDPSCTHLMCSKPARNEKSLSCMAAGKWILHTSYLEKSIEAGHFLDEENFEYGNPKFLAKFFSSNEKESELRMQMMHWWRKEVARRGYGAFNDMRAIVVANKREPIVRVIEAGGGVVIDAKPPFTNIVHATHCLLEQKSVKKIEDYIPLAKQGIYLVNTVYISDYLHQPDKDIKDCILPFFSRYYDRK